MQINRPDDLGDIANLGLTLAEGKLELAGHCHVNPGAAGVRAKDCCSYGLCCLAGTRFLVPDMEGLRADLAIGRSWQSVAARTEVAVNEGVGGKEVLGMPGRFEPLRLPLSSSCRSM